MKIAIASEDVLYRSILTEKLKILGHNKIIFEAKDWKELIQKITTEKPDLLFIDIVMQEISRDQVAEGIRKLWEDIVVICQSHYCLNGCINKLQQLGVKGYLLKECDEEQIEKAIHCAMSGQFFLDKRLIQKFTHSIDSIDSNLRIYQIVRLMFFDGTISEIADKLNISEPVIYRELKMFKNKYHIKTDTGLIKFGLQIGIIDINKELDINKPTVLTNTFPV